MEKGESQMFRLALLIWVVLGTTLAGMAIVVVVSDASLYNQGMKLIPIAAIVGFVVAIPLSFMISKRIS
jgi:putative flippase GtrA